MLEHKDLTMFGFVLRAEELNEPHLSNVISNIGISVSLKEFSISIGMFLDKILYIESGGGSTEVSLIDTNQRSFLSVFALLIPKYVKASSHNSCL